MSVCNADLGGAARGPTGDKSRPYRKCGHRGTSRWPSSAWPADEVCTESAKLSHVHFSCLVTAGSQLYRRRVSDLSLRFQVHQESLNSPHSQNNGGECTKSRMFEWERVRLKNIRQAKTRRTEVRPICTFGKACFPAKLARRCRSKSPPSTLSVWLRLPRNNFT